MFMVPLAGAEKNLLRAVQKDPEARRAKKRRAEAYFQYVASRLSGNEAFGSFSAAVRSAF
jgi:Tfp pilus assembly protein PilF